MNRLVKAILRNIQVPIFTSHDISLLVPETPEARYALVKRAIADGDLIRIKRGLYTLSPLYRKNAVHPFAVSQMIITRSYISLESALSSWGWIPEAVRSITAVTIDYPTEFNTPLGHFTYERVVQKTLFAAVERLQDGYGNVYFQATPLKALADYIYLHRLNWDSSIPLLESLRIDEDSLHDISLDDFLELEGNYSNARVNRFLAGLRKDLQL